MKALLVTLLMSLSFTAAFAGDPALVEGLQYDQGLDIADPLDGLSNEEKKQLFDFYFKDSKLLKQTEFDRYVETLMAVNVNGARIAQKEHEYRLATLNVGHDDNGQGLNAKEAARRKLQEAKEELRLTQTRLELDERSAIDRIKIYAQLSKLNFLPEELRADPTKYYAIIGYGLEQMVKERYAPKKKSVSKVKDLSDIGFEFDETEFLPEVEQVTAEVEVVEDVNQEQINSILLKLFPEEELV